MAKILIFDKQDFHFSVSDLNYKENRFPYGFKFVKVMTIQIFKLQLYFSVKIQRLRNKLEFEVEIFYSNWISLFK